MVSGGAHPKPRLVVVAVQVKHLQKQFPSFLYSSCLDAARILSD